jgi:hypothetical protein
MYIFSDVELEVQEHQNDDQGIQVDQQQPDGN